MEKFSIKKIEFWIRNPAISQSVVRTQTKKFLRNFIHQKEKKVERTQCYTNPIEIIAQESTGRGVGRGVYITFQTTI